MKAPQEEHQQERQEEHQHDRPVRTTLDAQSAGDLAARFKLLADANRLLMIYLLLEAGELCVGELAGMVGSSESATSHQLRQLRLAGLVRSRKHGREVFYRVADLHVRLLLDVAIEHYRHDGEPPR